MGRGSDAGAAHRGALRSGAEPVRDQHGRPATSRATSGSATWCSPAPSGTRSGGSVNEYSQYEQNYNAGARNNPPTGYPGTQEGFACLNDPYYGGGSFTGCNPATQYLLLQHQPSSAGRTSCGSHPKRAVRFHWLVGAYWQVTNDNNITETYYMPGLQYNGAAFQNELNYYGITQAIAARRSVVRVHRNQSRPRDQRIRQHQFRRDRQAERGSGGRALPLLFELRHALAGLCLCSQHAELRAGDLAQGGRQGRHQLQDHRSRHRLRRLGAGLPAGRQQCRIAAIVLHPPNAQRRDPELHSGHAQ